MAGRLAIICTFLVATGAVSAVGAHASATSDSGATAKSASSLQTVLIGQTPICHSLFCYSPATVTVKKGGTVVWLNGSVAPHTVTGVSGGPHSGALLPAQPYTFTFKTAGSYSYFCQIHGFALMHGTVNVTG